MTSQNERTSYLPGQGEQFAMDPFASIPTLDINQNQNENLPITTFPQVPTIPSFRETMKINNPTIIPSNQTLSGSIGKPIQYNSAEVISTLRPTIPIPRQTVSYTNQSSSPRMAPSVIDNLKTPIYESPTSTDTEIRKDEVMDILTKNGYMVLGRLYHNKNVEYLMARSPLGDLFFIYIDNMEYRNTFPILTSDNISNINLNEKNNMILVPQDTIISSLECLKNTNSSCGTACGAAFICNDNICITKKRLTNDPTQIQFNSENYVFGTNTIIGGNLDSSVRSYPIVNLNSLINNPNAKYMIEDSNKALRMLAIQKNQTKLQYLKNILNDYQKILTNAETLMPSLIPMDTYINKLSGIYKCTLPQYRNELSKIEKPLADGKDSIDSIITSVDGLLNNKLLDNLDKMKCDLNDNVNQLMKNVKDDTSCLLNYNFKI